LVAYVVPRVLVSVPLLKGLWTSQGTGTTRHDAIDFRIWLP
jgi:hypothetical protein